MKSQTPGFWSGVVHPAALAHVQLSMPSQIVLGGSPLSVMEGTGCRSSPGLAAWFVRDADFPFGAISGEIYFKPKPTFLAVTPWC